MAFLKIKHYGAVVAIIIMAFAFQAGYFYGTLSPSKDCSIHIDQKHIAVGTREHESLDDNQERPVVILDENQQELAGDTKDRTSQHVHPVTESILQGNKVILVNMGSTAKRHGIFSLSYILTDLSLYAEDSLDKLQLFIYQKDMDNYRYNSSIGFWGGDSFTTDTPVFPVINSYEEIQLMNEQLRGHGYHYDFHNLRPWPWPQSEIDTSTSLSKVNQDQIVTYDLNNETGYRDISLTNFFRVHEQLCPGGKPTHCDWTSPNKSYIMRKIKHLCSLMNFTYETRQKIKLIHHRNGHDKIFMNETVAFHVRRGDKNLEVPHTRTDTYVRILVDKGIHHHVKNCFMISDQPQEVLPEFQESLQKYGVSCEVYPKPSTPLNHGIDRQNASDTLALLAELDNIIRAEFFIFTGTSNLGEVAASLRGCKDHNSNRGHNSDFVNMFNSHNIDDF